MTDNTQRMEYLRESIASAEQDIRGWKQYIAQWEAERAKIETYRAWIESTTDLLHMREHELGALEAREGITR